MKLQIAVIAVASAVALSGCSNTYILEEPTIITQTVDEAKVLNRVHVRDDAALLQTSSRGGAAIRGDEDSTQVLYNQHHMGASDPLLQAIASVQSNKSAENLNNYNENKVAIKTTNKADRSIYSKSKKIDRSIYAKDKITIKSKNPSALTSPIEKSPTSKINSKMQPKAGLVQSTRFEKDGTMIVTNYGDDGVQTITITSPNKNSNANALDNTKTKLN